jgi:hypothetical protein
MFAVMPGLIRHPGILMLKLNLDPGFRRNVDPFPGEVIFSTSVAPALGGHEGLVQNKVV